MTSLLDTPGAPWFGALRHRPRSFHALRSDPRVSYTVHAPSGFFSDPSGYRLIVVVHGSGRSAAAYRDGFASFADQHRCVVLAPLFPVGVLGDGYEDGYKNLMEGTLRYDKLLLAMVADLEEAAGRAFGRFHLFGFSGGGQFVQRFFFLHPEQLASVSIGAPGAVTRLDPSRDWWFGTRNFKTLFDKELSLDAMRGVPVQMLVGDRDIETFKIPPRLQALIDSLGPIGSNRIERLQLLKENFEAFGIPVRFDLLPDVAHEGHKTFNTAQDFIRSTFTT